jgi:hypothetical protein
MNMRTRVTLIAAAVLAAAGFAACNDSDDCCDDLESYFERLDEIDNERRADFQQLDQDIAAVFPPGATGGSLNESTRGLIAEAYGRGEQILDESVRNLEEISPPEAVAAAHSEAVEGFIDFRQSFSVLRSRVPNINSTEDLIAAIEGQADAGERANAACDNLQQIADSNSIEVTLDCGVEVQ